MKINIKPKELIELIHPPVKVETSSDEFNMPGYDLRRTASAGTVSIEILEYAIEISDDYLNFWCGPMDIAVIEGNIFSFRQYQNMYWCFGVNVMKGNHMIVFIDLIAR